MGVDYNKIAQCAKVMEEACIKVMQLEQKQADESIDGPEHKSWGTMIADTAENERLVCSASKLFMELLSLKERNGEKKVKGETVRVYRPKY